MIKKNRIFIISVISAALFIGSLVALAGRSQGNKQNPRKVDDRSLAKQIDDEATPIVDLQNPDTSDRVDKNNRRIKNARHDNSGFDKTRPLPTVGDVVGYPEWRAGFSDLPAASSDLIVEAVVSESHAFLSNDKTGVYSEFTLLVSKPPKFTTGLGVNVNDRIVGERYGTKIKYPSGLTANRGGLSIEKSSGVRPAARRERYTVRLRFAFAPYASRTFQTDSQLPLGGAFILT